MADLVLRKEDDWHEITELIQNAPFAVQEELWGYAGQGNVEEIAALLDIELGEELMDLMGGIYEITGATAALWPDDILGERMRVWIQARPLRTKRSEKRR